MSEGKPSPEGYLLGRQGLGVAEPHHKVVIFEDAAAGVRAGKAAGATVVSVLETHSRKSLEQAGTDYIVRGLHQVRMSGLRNGLMTLEILPTYEEEELN